MSFLPELVCSIERRLDELAAEIASLEEARDALRTASPTADVAQARVTRPGRRRATRSRTASVPESVAPTAGNGAVAAAAVAAIDVKSNTQKKRRRRRAKSAPRRPVAPMLPPADLEQMLARAASGLSASEIALETDAGYSGVLKLLRELESSGRVRRTGSRRSTLWRLVTDDERIAERAAELERLFTASN
jgi:hypothetical protein